MGCPRPAWTRRAGVAVEGTRSTRRSAAGQGRRFGRGRSGARLTGAPTGRDYFLGGFGCGWPGLLCPPPGCQGFGWSFGLSMRSPPLGEFATTQIMEGAWLRQHFRKARRRWRNFSTRCDVLLARNSDLSRVSGDARA